MASLNHTHSYERVGPRGKEKIWRCNHPDCTHYLKKELVLGKRSVCGCGETFIIDAGAMQRKLPKCINCRDTAEARAHNAAKSLIEQVLGEKANETLADSSQ